MARTADIVNVEEMHVPTTQHTQPFTIVVIDDHVSLAKGFAMALQQGGFSAHVAHTAEDGLQLVQSRHPDAIVLDFRMPLINGAGFLYRLRQLSQFRTTPVLVVTGGSVNEEVREELRNLHAVLRFKPLSAAALLADVRTLLEDPSTPRSS